MCQSSTARRRPSSSAVASGLRVSAARYQWSFWLMLLERPRMTAATAGQDASAVRRISRAASRRAWWTAGGASDPDEGVVRLGMSTPVWALVCARTRVAISGSSLSRR